jgi:hypothetical protein
MRCCVHRIRTSFFEPFRLSARVVHCSNRVPRDVAGCSTCTRRHEIVEWCASSRKVVVHMRGYSFPHLVSAKWCGLNLVNERADQLRLAVGTRLRPPASLLGEA